MARVWHKSGKNGISPHGIFWDFFLGFIGTPMDTFPLRNPGKQLFPILPNGGPYLPVLVVPIHKNGAKTDVANYRPISLLSTFSKLYEKAMHARINDFPETNDTLYEMQ